MPIRSCHFNSLNYCATIHDQNVFQHWCKVIETYHILFAIARNDVKEAVRKAFLCLDAEMQSEMTSMGHQKSPTVANCSPRSGLPVSAAGGTGGGTYHHRSAVAGLKSSDTSSNKFINPGDELAGSTGNIVLIRDGVLYCGNAGDSRAVCSCMGVADALSSDHKPTLRGEKERIQAAGGWVDANRVNGNLALSRAFGDFVFKRNPVQNAENQIVSANPEVSVRRLKEDEDEFIVLCCDGIWDVMTNQEVISFVRLRLSCGMDPSKVGFLGVTIDPIIVVLSDHLLPSIDNENKDLRDRVHLNNCFLHCVWLAV